MQYKLYFQKNDGNPMNDIEQQFCTFVESLDCPDMISALQEGFKSLYETSDTVNVSDSGMFDMSYDAWDGPDFWDFNGASDASDVRITLNLSAWFNVAGVAELLSADEYAAILDGWRSSGIKDEDFGKVTISGWYSRPSAYDPGDGDCHCRIDAVPDEEYLTEMISNDIDYLADKCPALGKPGVKAALVSAVPELAAELRSYKGYED